MTKKEIWSLVIYWTLVLLTILGNVFLTIFSFTQNGLWLIIFLWFFSGMLFAFQVESTYIIFNNAKERNKSNDR